MQLQRMGWEKYMSILGDRTFDTDFVARVTSENRTNYTLMTSQGERLGVLRGKTLFMLDAEVLPKVGDWVVFSNEEEGSLVAIEEILPRHTKLSRQAAGHAEEEQVMVTNVDTVFIVQGLDDNFNINRIERYLVMVENSGAQPVVVLNKSDVVDDPKVFEDMVHDALPHVPVVIVSAQTQTGVGAFDSYLKPQTTSVFVGSSGVGKSTLLNALLGEDVQETQDLRDDDQGRHTTTRRELFVLPNGAIIIDTPGMRELGIKGAESVHETFEQCEELASQCTYRKCDHVATDGCALRQAVEDGELDESKVEHYLKILRERDFERAKIDKTHGAERKARIKKQQKGYKKILQNKYRGRDSFS